MAVTSCSVLEGQRNLWGNLKTGIWLQYLLYVNCCLLNALEGNQQNIGNLYNTFLKCTTRIRNQQNTVNCIQYIFKKLNLNTAPQKWHEICSCEISFNNNCSMDSYVRLYIVYIYVLELNTKLTFLIWIANFFPRFVCSFKRTDIDMWDFDDMKMPHINF
jgi:hypothetical protein